jgi:hypothetical protein
MVRFGRTEITLPEEKDCSTSSSDDNDDADEYDHEELLSKFQKLISKHIKLQKRYVDILCSHKVLMHSYALLESTHEVMITTIKDYQLTLAHVHNFLLIYLVLTLVAPKQSHHVMSMYL